MTERRHIPRWIVSVALIATWVFLVISLATFSPEDWPSHAVYPWPQVGNACGVVGAFLAYHANLLVGHGVFPILFFTGVFLALRLSGSRVSDPWLRVTGVSLLAVTFAATVHHFRPGDPSGFPEGQGGLLGIAAAGLLHDHFSTAGTLLVLLVVALVGLLLAADDLVLAAPRVVVGAWHRGRAAMPSLPKLPSIGLPVGPARGGVEDVDETNTDAAPPLIVVEVPKRKRSKVKPADLLDQSPVERSTDVESDRDAEPLAVSEQLEASDDGEDPAASRLDQPPPEPKNDIVVRLPSMLKPKRTAPPPPKELGEYQLPQWDCLADPEQSFAESREKFVREQAAVLEQALKEFDIDARVVAIDTGPVITLYEIALAPGIKVNTITALSNDIMRALQAESVRIVAPIPGKNTVGIEVPNQDKEKVRLKELMQLAPEAVGRDFMIPLFLGKDASGNPLITDLTKMPHCLIAGTTGSGKSVCINSIIMSVMYLQRPDVVKLILVDPKVVEMAPFKDIPHLMCPVINESVKATSVLEWATQKMDERYEFLAEAGVRNIKDYNKLTLDELIERFEPATPEEEARIPKKLPYIVVIVDELADLMMTSGKEVESHIVRIAQKARAVGIHLILATQRPQATVVTGLIKANMPSKIAFRVASKMDSRIVLDMNGAEVLLGQGDMLFMPPGASKPIRGQGTFIDDREIRESVKLVKNAAEQQFEPELVQIKASATVDEEAANDPLFDQAVRVVLETRRGSVSLLQRRLTIGYARASRLIEAMAAAGIVGDYKGSQAREANITLEQWEAMKAAQQADAESGMTV